MLFKWESDKKFNGVKLGQLSPSVSNFLFTDGILIFCRANVEEDKNIHKYLQLYCKWTSHAFNRKKSGCFFSRNVL